MRFHDGAANGQTYTGPMTLGREERIEDLVRLPRWQPHAGIAHAHGQFLVVCSILLNGELAPPTHILHRLDAIKKEVHHDLLQLHAISHDLRKIWRQLRAN